MAKLIGLIVSVALAGCSASPETDTSPNNSVAVQETTVSPPPTPRIESEGNDRFSLAIAGIKGLIVLSDNYQKPNDIIRIYNDDGSVWYEFTFYYDDSDGHYEYQNDKFQPFLNSPDYFGLALKVTDEDARRYEVIVNEDSGARKFVSKSDKNLKFETWQAHILGMFAVQFDSKKNPIKETPSGNVKRVDSTKIERFEPKTIEGDWLKVEWDLQSNPAIETRSRDSGWIRWKKEDHILIEWFHTA